MSLRILSNGCWISGGWLRGFSARCLLEDLVASESYVLDRRGIRRDAQDLVYSCFTALMLVAIDGQLSRSWVLVHFADNRLPSRSVPYQPANNYAVIHKNRAGAPMESSPAKAASPMLHRSWPATHRIKRRLLKSTHPYVEAHPRTICLRNHRVPKSQLIPMIVCEKTVHGTLRGITLA